jgi:hypothetical protein
VSDRDRDLTITVIACAIAWPLEIYLILWVLRGSPMFGPFVEPIFTAAALVRDSLKLKLSRRGTHGFK